MTKRPKDMTQDELEALPEYSAYDIEIIQPPDPRFPNAKLGDTVQIPRMKKGFVTYHEEDDIIFFTDREGQTWKPLMDENGWCKERFSL